MWFSSSIYDLFTVVAVLYLFSHLVNYNCFSALDGSPVIVDHIFSLFQLNAPSLDQLIKLQQISWILQV
jgi:hypothetical protein